ncbi:MAG: LysE/ArgO family amino acid transporter [Pseudomonadota bacterium]|jgi:L-lysine exporter family protein LysE/ArgO|uniref:Transporter, LysE family n=1 Tax=Caballeronia sordidicola TaxID=196367 RepID=A0A242M3Y0_CABSO|nr:LysE/ArgO family amino acid transporter [Caballeronia sordidicola]MDP9156139.1 LysE/ArgO family amino acid transporter [Pseudomonadota bacterium]OTP65891.1 Transporter, LysE family [Caballeronia sordidicola]
MTTAFFLSGAGLGASLIIAIGAQNAFVLRQGLKRRHVGLVVSICALIDVLLIGLGIGGMGALIARAPVLLDVIRWAGAVFLFLYGVRAFHAAWKGPGHLQAENGETQTALKAASTVLALSLLNPHVYLDTVVLLGGIGAQYGWPGNAWFAAGAMCSSVIWFTTLGFGARLLRPLFEKDLSWRVLDVIVGVVMWWIAGMLIFSR